MEMKQFNNPDLERKAKNLRGEEKAKFTDLVVSRKAALINAMNILKGQLLEELRSVLSREFLAEVPIEITEDSNVRWGMRAQFMVDGCTLVIFPDTDHVGYIIRTPRLYNFRCRPENLENLLLMEIAEILDKPAPKKQEQEEDIDEIPFDESSLNQEF